MIGQLIEYLAHFVISIISIFGYWGVFLAMTMEAACIPLPSEIIMPFAGFLVFKGQMNLIVVGGVGALGDLAGSLLAYWVGARGGRTLALKYGKYILVSSGDLDLADRWFTHYGRGTVFFARFIPVVRTFISLPAGISRMKLSTFAIYTFLGALPWSLTLTYVGYQFGENWDALSVYFHKFDILIGITILVGAVWYVRRHLKRAKGSSMTKTVNDKESV